MKGKMINDTTSIKYDLKGDLLEERSSELANKIKEQIVLQVEKSAMAKEYKKKIDAIQADIERLSEDIHNGFEIVEVACKKYKDYQAQKWIFVNDEGEIIKMLPMSENDLQSSIEDYE